MYQAAKPSAIGRVDGVSRRLNLVHGLRDLLLTPSPDNLQTTFAAKLNPPAIDPGETTTIYWIRQIVVQASIAVPHELIQVSPFQPQSLSQSAL
jgi:hypothetical protein